MNGGAGVHLWVRIRIAGRAADPLIILVSFVVTAVLTFTEPAEGTGGSGGGGGEQPPPSVPINVVGLGEGWRAGRVRQYWLAPPYELVDQTCKL